MSTNLRLLLIAGLCALLAALFLIPDEEDRLLARLEQLRDLAEVGEPQTAVQQALAAKQIGQLFLAPVALDLTSADLGIVEIPDARQLTQSVLKVRSRLSRLELDMQAPRFSIEADHAEVELLGSALGRLRNAQDEFLEIHRILVTFRKSEGEWLITGARHIRNERAPVAGKQPS